MHGNITVALTYSGSNLEHTAKHKMACSWRCYCCMCDQICTHSDISCCFTCYRCFVSVTGFILQELQESLCAPNCVFLLCFLLLCCSRVEA